MKRVMMLPAILTAAALTVMSFGQSAPPVTGDPSGSLLTQQQRHRPSTPDSRTGRHQLRSMSMFAVAPPEPRVFQVHDLVQIVVREISQTRRSHELETEKEYNLDGAITAWPHFDLSDLLQLQLQAGRSSTLPAVGLDFNKEFEGEGEYTRRDDMSDRLTAEVIEVLPNGNLVLEARSFIKTDEEESSMKVTGICRPDDVSPANTVLSSQVHDLRIVKEHTGELKQSNEKGIIAQVLDFIFAF